MDIVYLKNKLKTLNQMLQQLDETWMIIAQMMTIIFFMFRNKDPLALYSSQSRQVAKHLQHFKTDGKANDPISSLSE